MGDSMPSMAKRRHRAPRISLVTRLYLAGVAVFTLSALAAWGIVHYVSHEWPGAREIGHFTRFVAVSVGAEQDPREAVERAHGILEADVALFSADGDLIAHGGPVPPPPRTAPARGEMRARSGGGYEIGVDGGRTVVVIYRRTFSRIPWLFGIAGALLVIAMGAWIGGRSMARRLARLGATARAITAGELGARTRIESSDEIGEAAEAFDRMAERVEHLLRSQRELLASVSHELRTPLARLRVALDLANEARDPEAMQAEVVGLGRDLEELELLVSDLLVTARMDARGPSAELPLRREKVSVREVLEHAKARWSERNPERVVAVSVCTDALAEIDPRLMRRAIQNVFDNAHKYSDPSAPVHVSLTAKDGLAVIEIRDEGIGIAPEDLTHVLSPFFRADRPEVLASSGLGLGLAFTRRIVEAHGGTIVLESRLGAGTTVRLAIPSVDA